ncbi:MAG: enoyl-CoA hydratase/isomerase family protein [Pseudomonadota bacterium]
MSEEKAALYSVEDGVALISHNRPKHMNALSRQLRTDLAAAMDAAESNEDVHIVILTGEGRAFGAGADLADLDNTDHDTVTDHILKDHKPIIDRIRLSKKPYIAAINGATAGISVAYALACDLIVMSDTGFLYSPFASISLVPDGGTCWFLMQRLGRQRAYEMIIESGRLSAEECLEIGVANKVVPAENLRAEAMAWAQSLVKDRAPLSLRYVKETLNYVENTAYEAAIRKEAELQQYCIESRDFREGVESFMEKRKPVFTGE